MAVGDEDVEASLSDEPGGPDAALRVLLDGDHRSLTHGSGRSWLLAAEDLGTRMGIWPPRWQGADGRCGWWTPNRIRWRMRYDAVTCIGKWLQETP